MTAKAILRIWRLLLLSLLITYWVVLLVYTIKNLITGGPDAVLNWYQHILGIIRLDDLNRSWSWRAFLGRQIAIAIFTIIAVAGSLREGRKTAFESKAQES